MLGEGRWGVEGKKLVKCVCVCVCVCVKFVSITLVVFRHILSHFCLFLPVCLSVFFSLLF